MPEGLIAATIAADGEDWMEWTGQARDPSHAIRIATADAARAWSVLTAHRATGGRLRLAARVADARPLHGTPSIAISTAMWLASGMPGDGRNGPTMPWTSKAADDACALLARLAGYASRPREGPFGITTGGYGGGHHIWQPLCLKQEAEGERGDIHLEGAWRAAGIAVTLAALATGKGSWGRLNQVPTHPSATMRAIAGREARHARPSDARAIASLMRAANLARDAALIEKIAARTIEGNRE